MVTLHQSTFSSFQLPLLQTRIGFFVKNHSYSFYEFSHPSMLSFRFPFYRVRFGVSLSLVENFKPFSANPTKWTNTLKQSVGKLPTNCLSVFDHFVWLALKELIFDILWNILCHFLNNHSMVSQLFLVAAVRPFSASHWHITWCSSECIVNTRSYIVSFVKE